MFDRIANVTILVIGVIVLSVACFFIAVGFSGAIFDAIRIIMA